jgi:hypothetical protein
MLENRKRTHSDVSEGSIGSLKDFIGDEVIVDGPIKMSPEDELEHLKKEAEAFAGPIQGTVVGGRTLRSRKPEDLEKRKPKDSYYERFGKQEEEKLMEKFTKKDMIEFLKTLKAEHLSAYESAGHSWPALTTKMSLEHISEEYYKIKEFIGLPDSDAEDDDDDASDADDETEVVDTVDTEADADTDDDTNDDESDAESEDDADDDTDDDESDDDESDTESDADTDADTDDDE